MAGEATKVRVEFEVPFHDVDMMGIVWHGHYYKYFELARTALLRSLGLDSGEIVGARYRFVVIDSRCRYIHSLRYAERVRVTAWITEHRHRVRIAYEIKNLNADRRAARGHTVLATTDLDGKLLMDTPDDIVRRILGQ